MKKLADAAIVAVLLMLSCPDLLPEHSCDLPASLPTEAASDLPR